MILDLALSELVKNTLRVKAIKDARPNNSYISEMYVLIVLKSLYTCLNVSLFVFTSLILTTQEREISTYGYVAIDFNTLFLGGHHYGGCLLPGFRRDF